MRLRNGAYDAGLLRARRVAAQVISVGNLTLGGTGKTPLVALLARAARAAGRNPAILLRGYRRGARRAAGSDEAALHARLTPGVSVVAEPDRVQGAARALAAGADLLILDDGFQHRRLARDVDLVLADARDPSAGGRLLPRGLLREPISSLARAHALILTRCERASAAEIEAGRRRALAVAPGLPVLCEAHRPRALVDAHGAADADLERLAGRRVLCFAGIADPTALCETVTGLGASVVKAVDFGDHHEFSPADLARLEREAEECEAAIALTTEKDLMRIDRWGGAVPLLALRVEAELLEPEGAALLGRLVGFPL